MGTSEGAMVLSRFDDQRYGSLINGRVLSAYSVEYCYFTPDAEAARFGGNLNVPTLNIIGTHDEYFGVHGSIAQGVAASGHGTLDLHGHAFQTMLRQGMPCGCVCTFEGGKHDLTK